MLASRAVNGPGTGRGGEPMSPSRHAVIGDPVAHSLSPQIHEQFGAQLGIALRYTRIRATVDELPALLARLHAEGWAGLNVTLPHKTQALALSVEAGEAARQAGAANTLVREAQGWRAENTDGAGLVADLARLGVDVAGARVLVLGAGGAARGILGPLLVQGPAELVLSSRNPWKPEALAETFGALGNYRPCSHYALKGDRFDLVVNATSVGHDGRFLRLPAGLFAAGGVAYDLSYGAAHAPFSAWAAEQGAARIHDGLGMLIEQAAEAFALWHGRRPDTGPVHEALRARIGRAATSGSLEPTSGGDQ